MVGGGNGEGAPPSTAAESVFNGGEAVGYSPGPMTLLSNLLGNGDEYKSFSEFLAGAMMDPTPPRFFPDSPSQVTHLICDILSYHIFTPFLNL